MSCEYYGADVFDIFTAGRDIFLRYKEMLFRPALIVSVVLGVADAYAAPPAAPDGIGPLKFGMTPPQVEKLQQGTVVISNFQVSDKQDIPGRVEYTSTLKSPLSIYPTETDLGFAGGKLVSIFLRFSAAPSDSSVSLTGDQQDAIKMLTAKYGVPKIEKNWEDKQCIYGSGNSFTKKNGSEQYRWSFALPGGMETAVTVRTWIFDTCPASLRYNFSTKIELRSLQMGLYKKSPPKANLF